MRKLSGNGQRSTARSGTAWMTGPTWSEWANDKASARGSERWMLMDIAWSGWVMGKTKHQRRVRRLPDENPRLGNVNKQWRPDSWELVRRLPKRQQSNGRDALHSVSYGRGGGAEWRKMWRVFSRGNRPHSLYVATSEVMAMRTL